MVKSTFVLFVTLSALQCVSNSASPISVQDSIAEVMSTTDATLLSQNVSEWAQEPCDARIRIASDIVPFLLDGSGCPPLPGIDADHDLGSISGRAAWIIESLLGTDLEPVNSEMDPEDELSQHELAVQALSAFIAGKEGIERQHMILSESADATPSLSVVTLDYVSRIRNSYSPDVVDQVVIA